MGDGGEVETRADQCSRLDRHFQHPCRSDTRRETRIWSVVSRVSCLASRLWRSSWLQFRVVLRPHVNLNLPLGPPTPFKTGKPAVALPCPGRVRADPAHLPGRKPVARLQFKFAAPSESATCDCIYPTGRCASKLPPDNATSPPQPTPNLPSDWARRCRRRICVTGLQVSPRRASIGGPTRARLPCYCNTNGESSINAMASHPACDCR